MRIFVPCKIGQGFLSNERVITIRDIEGQEHTSIVAEDEIEGNKVEVSVVKVQDDKALIHMPGEPFCLSSIFVRKDQLIIE